MCIKFNLRSMKEIFRGIFTLIHRSLVGKNSTNDEAKMTPKNLKNNQNERKVMSLSETNIFEGSRPLTVYQNNKFPCLTNQNQFKNASAQNNELYPYNFHKLSPIPEEDLNENDASQFPKRNIETKAQGDAKSNIDSEIKTDKVIHRKTAIKQVKPSISTEGETVQMLREMTAFCEVKNKVRKGNGKPENAGCRLKVLSFQDYKNVKKRM